MREYSGNRQLVPNQIVASAKALTICNAAYNDIQFDMRDISIAAAVWGEYIAPDTPLTLTDIPAPPVKQPTLSFEEACTLILGE